MKRILTIIAFVTFTFALAMPLIAWAESEVLPEEDCTLDDYGELCEQNGLYGTCTEVGPNGCNGENPDYPGDCRGYPDCSIESCGIDAEVGDSCAIDDIAGDCQLRCDMTGEECSEDEPINCDISNALNPDPEEDEDEDDSDAGCSTTGQQGPTGLLIVVALLAGLTFTRRN